MMEVDNNKADLISVIVPIYKTEKYLEQCVTSIQNQTYNNIEIILVDDGSPDQCPEICDRIAKEDSRIVVIHKANGGLSDARNCGLDIARGKWIFFVDSDDMIHKETLNIMYESVLANNADMAVCQYERVKSFPKTDKEIDGENIISISNMDMLRMLCNCENEDCVIAWNKLTKKSIWDALRFPVGRIHEDEYVAAEVIYRAKKISYVKEQLYYYLQREDSITGAISLKGYFDAIAAFQERTLFFKDIEMLDFAKCTQNILIGYFLSRFCYIKSKIDKEAYKKIKDDFRNSLKKSNMKKVGWKVLIHIAVFYVSPKLYRVIMKLR